MHGSTVNIHWYVTELGINKYQEGFKQDCKNMIHSLRYFVTLLVPILSFSLLSLCVVHAGEIKNQTAKISDGQQVTYRLPDDSVYKGPIQSGLFNGVGNLTWGNGGSYEGEFKSGHMSGKGILTTRSGDTYRGEFRNGMANGYGEWSYRHGDSYKGQLVDGLFQGKGIYLTSSGDEYDADFFQGKAKGKGVITYSDGSRYEGEIRDWKPHGNGKFEKFGSESYEGRFKDGTYHGKGSIIYANGDRYTGEFKNNRFNGLGELTDKNGKIYKGQYSKGVLIGEADIRFVDGSYYKGSVQNWTPHGQGELVYKQGDKYVGEFVNGFYEGKGMFTYKEGDRYVGEFKRGRYHGKGKFYYSKTLGGKAFYTGEWEKGHLVKRDGEKITDKTIPIDKLYVEERLYQQAAILSPMLNTLRQGELGKPELYFLSFGSDGGQDVFMKEANFSKTLFDKHFGSEGRSIALINNKKTNAKTPMATVGNLKRTLKVISERMNKDEDILFLYVTSHGSKKYGITVKLGGVYLHDLKAQELATILKESGIKWKVIVVSACYSGTFLDDLRDDDTLVITSSKADHVSFGCSDEAEFTFFGKAFLKESLAKTKSFVKAFEQAKTLVAQWEKKEKYSHSEPQIASSEKIEAHLREWLESLNQDQVVTLQ